MTDGGLSWWSALKWAWANKGEILAHLGRVRLWFTKPDPERGILIIGAGGVGKTTLAAILAGTFDWLTSDPWEYQESFGIELSSLKDDPNVGIVVPPGRSARRDVLWTNLESDLAAGRFRGVIVVSANGYHSLAQLSYKAHALYAGNKDDFLTAYRAACRDNELTVLRRVAAAAKLCPKEGLATVVGRERRPVVARA